MQFSLQTYTWCSKIRVPRASLWFSSRILLAIWKLCGLRISVLASCHTTCCNVYTPFCCTAIGLYPVAVSDHGAWMVILGSEDVTLVSWPSTRSWCSTSKTAGQSTSPGTIRSMAGTPLSDLSTRQWLQATRLSVFTSIMPMGAGDWDETIADQRRRLQGSVTRLSELSSSLVCGKYTTMEPGTATSASNSTVTVRQC